MNVAFSFPKSVFFFILSSKEVLPKEGSYILSGEERDISVHVSKKYKPNSSWNWNEATFK